MSSVITAPHYPPRYAIPGTNPKLILYLGWTHQPIAGSAFQDASDALQLELNRVILREGNRPIPVTGLAMEKGTLAVSVGQWRNRRQDIRYVDGVAALKALGYLLHTYGYYEAGFNIFIGEYREGKGDGYVVATYISANSVLINEMANTTSPFTR